MELTPSELGMDEHYIYTYRHPDAGVYVGRTCNLERRHKQHRLAKGETPDFHDAIREHGGDLDKDWVKETFGPMTYADAKAKETELIAENGGPNHPLVLNRSAGSGAPNGTSSEVMRANISRAARRSMGPSRRREQAAITAKMWKDPAYRKHTTEAIAKANQDPINRAKISISNAAHYERSRNFGRNHKKMEQKRPRLLDTDGMNLRPGLAKGIYLPND